jgi:hypothetical protein
LKKLVEIKKIEVAKSKPGYFAGDWPSVMDSAVGGMFPKTLLNFFDAKVLLIFSRLCYFPKPVLSIQCRFQVTVEHTLQY